MNLRPSSVSAPRRGPALWGALLALLLVACRRDGAAPAAAPAAPLGVVATASTNRLHLGDLVQVKLAVEHPAAGRLELPDPARGKELVVRDRRQQVQPLPGQRLRTTVEYTLASYALGDHEVFTGAVRFAAGDGRRLEAPPPGLRLEVGSLLTGTERDVREIKGLVAWPAAFPRWLAVLLLVALLALGIGLILRHILSKPRTILQMPPALPPHERALRALRRLQERGWIEAGKVEPFYVELSAIVRGYIEERFHLRAPEQTTEEFLREAARSRLLSDEHQGLVSGFLEQCDLVKFARHRPSAEDMRAAMAAAERLVRETIPPPAAKTDGAP